MLFVSAILVVLVGATKARPDDGLSSPNLPCGLPPLPKNGRFKILGSLNETSGFLLDVRCDPGYHLSGFNLYACNNSEFFKTAPECLTHCNKIKTGPLLCTVMEEEDEGPGPRCLVPDHAFSLDQRISSEQEDLPSCGTGVNDFAQYVAAGRRAVSKELPWHAGVYTKKTRPYMQICGGSLVKENVVISAAHCFWSDMEKQKPASDYAVAVGKLYRPWNDKHDDHAQKSDVAVIKIPPRFQGSASNFQDDIALVIVTTPFTFTDSVRPVCLNFEFKLDTKQLTPGNRGMVAGWGLTGDNAMESPVLNVVELPVVAIEECIEKLDPSFRNHITGDKICAGYQNGTAVCKGDSGGGLSFRHITGTMRRYFLRGIVSSAPRNQNLCNTMTWATFTHLLKHEHFITETILEFPPSSPTTAHRRFDDI